MHDVLHAWMWQIIEAQVLQFPSATWPIYLPLQDPSWHIHNFIAAQHSYHTSSSSCVAHAVSIRWNGISNLDNSDKLYVDIQQRVYSHHSIKYWNWHMINITVIFNFWKKNFKSNHFFTHCSRQFLQFRVFCSGRLYCIARSLLGSW